MFETPCYEKKILLGAIASVAMLFTSAQNVGIGISTPLEKFHVDSGNIKIGKDIWTPLKSHLLRFGDGDFVHIGEKGDDSMEIKARYISFIEPMVPLPS